MAAKACERLGEPYPADSATDDACANAAYLIRALPLSIPPDAMLAAALQVPEVQ